MFKKILAFVVFTFLIIVGYSQTNSQNIKRPLLNLKLFVDDKSFYSSPIVESDYVVNDSIIQIFPGEKLFIEADVVRDRLTNFQVVNEIKNKDKTLVFEFQQKANGKVHEQMILTVTNPFNKTLQYKALINLMRTKRWESTSVLPIMPKLQSIEMWPDIITSVILVGFKLNEKNR